MTPPPLSAIVPALAPAFLPALLPRSLFGRLLWLLALTTLVSLLAAAAAFGVSTRESSAERLARGLHAQTMTADALLAQPDRAAALTQLGRLGIRFIEHEPPPRRAGLPLLREMLARLGARLPGREMRLGGDPMTLWLRVDNGRGWIGIPVLGAADPFQRGVLLSLSTIALVVLGAAGLFARTLTRPLRRLAEVAPGIVAGEAPPPPAAGASTEIHALHHALSDAAERTRIAARDRELMLAGLSHDMRTPLARLRYALALQDDTATDAETRTGMEQDIDALDAMVGQFIDYVRDGRDEPETTVDLAALLAEAAAAAGRGGQVLSVDAPASAPMPGRPLALRRALANLIHNAGLHGAAPFTAELRALPPGEGGGWRLRIADRGPGVPEDALPSLGRPFHRVDAARGGGGSGLGLASVARVAAVHGGALRLRNRAGGGLEAELRLPAARA